MSPRTRRATPEETRQIAARAAADAMRRLRRIAWRAVRPSPAGAGAFADHASSPADRHRREAKAARHSPEQEAELAAVLAELPRLTPDEIEAGRSPSGGFTRKQLAAWNVPWPPPAGWLQALLRGEGVSE